MKATEAKLLDFLKKSPQFVIPIYQRTYSWTEKECRQLWEDIVRCGSSEKITVHFVGSIVYVESGLSQAKRLILSLNMRFADVNDPKGLCRDVTGMGRWGNGDVEIGLSGLEDLPYVIGLVRQSLELQLGNSGEA